MISVFVSRPSILSIDEERTYEKLAKHLERNGMTARQLGRSDYSIDAPLRAVISIMRECRGAIIMGFPQVTMSFCSGRAGQPVREERMVLPTPWNQIEGALAFAFGIPAMVIADERVAGGIFDYGITGEFVLKADLSKSAVMQGEPFRQLFAQWSARVMKQ